MTVMLSLYIATAILGVGVTVLDMIGLIGTHSDEGDGHGSDEGSAAGSDAALLDADPGAADSGVDGDGGHAIGDDHGHDVEVYGSEHTGVLGPTREETRDGSLVVAGILRWMRNVVYFCIGFGVVGWYAIATGAGAAGSLLWSIPVGLLSLGGARLLRRLLRRELNSEIHTSELLMESGVVTVSIGKGQLGKVRVQLGDVYVERFARAKGDDLAIPVGVRVTVTDLNDECIFVEPVEDAGSEHGTR